MSINVVLAVGMDLWVLERKRKVWREAGYFVTPAGSVREAIDDFRSGDFDLVVMSASIPAESRERFTSMIRAAGSSVPVICATNPAGDWDLFANATIPKEHRGTGGRYRESGGGEQHAFRSMAAGAIRDEQGTAQGENGLRASSRSKPAQEA